MTRDPPEPVKKILRDEVVFGCPVRDCGSPYLEFHHFDPPWKDENHHRPEGMIALCSEHHGKAEGFTIEQLRTLKREAKNNWAQVRGRFDWMRNRLLAVVGGNFYYETLKVFTYKREDIIWFERDESGYLLLNLTMLTTSGEPRAAIRNNDWVNTGSEADIECPPNGKRLRISYRNGDTAKIEFVVLTSVGDANKRYKGADAEHWGIEFPLTAVEVTNVVAGTGIEFNPKETKIGGGRMRGMFMSHCGGGLIVD